MQSGSNSHSNVTEATGVEVSKPIQSAVDPAGDGCGHTQEDSVSGNGQTQAAGDGCGQITEEPVSSDIQTLDDDDEESETECEPVGPVVDTKRVVSMNEPLSWGCLDRRSYCGKLQLTFVWAV